MKSINPYSLEVIEEHDVLNDEGINAKLKLAQESFLKYRFKSFKYRSLRMLKVASILRKRSVQYAKMISLEMGKPITEARAEIEKSAQVCEYYAQNAENFLKEEHIETDAQTSYVSYEPLGVILAIMPWNFPFWQVFRFAAPNLMAGNTAVLKHAENVQGCAKVIEDILLDAGFEDGVFQNMSVNLDSVESIIRNKIIKAVSLTGSERAGAAVAKICAEEIKPTLLELGGSNAFVVLKDADLGKAIEIGVKARMLNAGQSCIAAKRFILEKQIAQDFIDGYCKKMSQLKIGDPLEDETELGPLARIDLAENLKSQISQSRYAGAKLMLGGQRNGAFIEPTVLIDVKPGMPAFDEELFGPVAAMIIADDAEHAIDLAQQTDFGLGISIMSKNVKKALKLSREIEDGAVFINELVKSDPRLPFGGTQKSGYGRELGPHGIYEFVNTKTIYIK